MSAMHHGDISLIRDEDLLKKMWQETEDFGKKKEIRSHMYKLREARLKDLYNTSEVKGVTITTNTKLPFNQSTHADSLADHSFASLKSKEIRDSESPTRDVSYRITGSMNNDGWNISKIDERSEDGKTHRIVQTAQTSGSEIIPKGKLDFEAKCDQAVTSFQDGDDKNFVRSQGLSSNTVMRQEAVGGDENCSFKTSSTKSSSSSKTVTEQKVSYDDSSDYIPHQHNSSNKDNYIQRSIKVYESDAPQEMKNHPGYVEGNTKITRETKTLADGTVVTTTKYETRGANETRSTSSNQYSSSNSNFQQSKSNYSSSTSQNDKYSTHKTIVDSEQLPKEQPQSRSRYYVEKTHTIPDNSSDSYQSHSSERKTIVDHQTYKKNDESISNQFSDKNYGTVITSDSRKNNSNIIQTDGFEKRTTRQEQYQENHNTTNQKSNRIENVRNERTNNVNKQHNTTVYQDVNSVPLGTPIEIEIDVSKMDINDKKTIEDTSCRQYKKNISKSPDRMDYSPEQKRQPIKPAENEWKTETKALKNQYDTTYKTDYTNKRISVELSPTHEAFARSLRAVSPDRLSSRSSSRNLKNSTTSLRSTSSPEKTYVHHGQPSRSSPESQRCYSPTKKTPERLSSTETITYNSRPSVERTSPHTSQKTKHITQTRVTSTQADISNIKTKSSNDTDNATTISKSTRTSPTKSPSRSSTPSKSDHHKTTVDITTDLDDNISTISNTTISKTERVRPSTLKYEVTETVGVTKHTQSSPSSHIPNKEKSTKHFERKDKPIDRPLKRTDTYEERCRQILGITNETTERRRSSLEKLKRRSSSHSTTTEISSKDTSVQQEIIPSSRTSPTKHIPQTKEKREKHGTPKKQQSPLQEFPAQIRRSPEKSTRQPSPTKNSSEKSPEPNYNRESPLHSKPSPKQRPEANDRRSPPSEVNKNLKLKSPDKDVRRDIQRSPSDSKKITENFGDVGDDNHQPETYDHKKNKTVLGKTQHIDIMLSVNKESTRRDYDEKSNCSEQTVISEISGLNTPQKIPRHEVVQVHNLTSEEIVSAKTLSTQSNDEYVIDNSVNKSQTLTFDKKSPKDEQPSVTDAVNIMFVKEEAENRLDNVTNLSENSNRKVHETQVTTSYNQSTEKNIMPISTPSKTSPIRKTSPLNKPSKETTRNEEINTTFIEHEVINRKQSEDQIDISKRKDSKTHKYIAEDNNTTTRKHSDVEYNEKTEIFKPTSNSTAPKTSSSRETSPLKEYPSQVRKNADIDDVNRKFISQEIVNRQVTPEVTKTQLSFEPKTPPTDKRPNTSRNIISTENEDVMSLNSSQTEAPRRTAPNEKVITKTNKYAIPEDIHQNTQVHQKYTIINLNQNTDTISINDSTEQIIDENKVIPNRKKTKLEDNFKPGTPPNVDLKNNSSPQHNVPKDRKSSPSQQDNLEEINKKPLENVSINSRKTLQQEEFPTSRKPSHPAESEIYSSQFSEDISQDASILVDDIIYTNGDIREKNNITENNVNVDAYTKNVFQNNSHDLHIDSQDEVEITITSKIVSTKKNRPDKLQKQKDIHNKEQNVSRNKEAVRNTVQSKGKPLNKTTEGKTSLVKKTVSTKDVSKPKDKPTQKVTNYASKKTTSVQIIKGEIPKHIQDKNFKIDTKKTKQPNVKLNDDREVKEQLHKKEYSRETYEGRTPVEEPLVIKKTVSLLYSDEEDDKKCTQMLIESEITDQKHIIEKKKDKPEKLAKTTSSKFIVNEKKESISRSKQPISKSSPKSAPVVEKNTLSGRNNSKPKMSGETEYTDKYKKKLVQSKYENNKRQNTITDIENFDDLKTDTSPHVRVHRIDDRTNKTKNFTLEIENNDGPIKIPKKITPLKKPSNDSPKSKTFSGNKVVTEKNLQSTKPKSVEPVQHLVKETKPSTKVKHIVSTTIVLNPKTTTSNVATVSSGKKKDLTKPVSTSSPTKDVIECEESDDESIPDSLDETIQNSVNNNEIVENQTENKISSRSNRSSPERKSPTRNYSQPDFREEKPKATKPKLEKRCISTKSIIINNADRGVTVDLQRSISSREPTPDRVCPLPVTSDDEGYSPRFPDKVVEPDDINSKRTSHRLFETVIQENEDGKDSQRIVEITEDFKQKVTEVDKVDRDDDSLLTVNKKINKFLTTADKLTEKPIMDISQPAPKVERQKFEITEDLREDDCLLSVSDKVNKFINEAEYLTSHNNSQPRKSVNIDNRYDITKKVTLTPELRVNQESPSKPSDKKYVPKNNAPLRNDTNQLFDQNVSTIQQDVFITTECDQIEKEEDSFRTTKHSPKVIHPEKKPEVFTTSDTNEKRISNFKPYSRGSKSPDKIMTDTCSAERIQSTETIRKTEKDIEHFTENEKFVETPQNKRKPEESSKTFTPKNRRPSQEEKIILSTVGRLRSNESIKKAKALFENKSSSKEFKKHIDVSNNKSVVEERNGSIKQITRRPIDRSSLTPKKLNFPSSDDKSVEQSNNKNFGMKHSVSHQYEVDKSRVSKSTKNTDEERDNCKNTTLRKQQSPQREVIKIKPTTRGQEPDRPGSKERDMPGYMKPLERNMRPHSPVDKTLDETERVHTHEDEVCIIGEEIPGYMKPLNRTTTHRSPQRENQHPYIAHEKLTYEESREVMPAYMKPSRTDRHNEHHYSSRTDRKENILSNESSQAHESISTIHHKKNHSKTSAVHQDQSHVDSISTEELPGYMKPLKQHIHQEEYSKITETHRRHDSREIDTTDELPGYMKPLMKHNPKIEDLPVSKTHDSDKPKGSIYSSDDIRGYMKPIHSHSHKHEHTDLTETEELSDKIIHGTNKPRASIHSDDIPGYMKPILSHSHLHEQTDSTHRDEISDSKTHRERNSREHSPHKDISPSRDMKGLMGPLDIDEVPSYMKPLDRAYGPHSPKRDSPSDHMKPLDRTDRPRSPKRDSPSGYMKQLDRTDRPCSPKRDSPSGYMKPFDRTDRPRSPKRDFPSSYMKPLDRTDRPCSPKRDSPSGYMKPLDKANSLRSPRKDSQSGKKPSEPHVTPTKFGVTLKKTDSMRGITNTTITPKKHPILSKKNITEEEIEEIFELEVLEELLLIVTGYELRRQIRTQIRTVKKLIAEDKLEVTIRNIRNKNDEVNQSKETTEVKFMENIDKSTKKTSQFRTTIDVDQRDIKETKKNAESLENTSSYARKESTSSLIRSETPVSRSSKSPERRSPERKSPSRLHAEEPSIKKSFDNNRHSTQKTNSVKIAEEQRTKTTNIFKSNLKKTENITKGPVDNIQPEWTSQRNLKKITTNDNVKKVVNATNKSIKKEPIRSSSPSKEMKSTDVITSSYGVGPTDENGTPLFGLKALRAQNKSSNTKVQGTVVSSQYYSETGKEPIGQISVTKYSSDPKDLGSNENLTYQDEGILSITTTQKFGFDDAPSLKQLTNTEGDNRDSQTNRKASTSKSSTVIRRNSVKALTQKFVENAVETSKSEQQSSYPKAGLILRSSSFKNESTSDASDRYSEVTAEERTQKSMSVISSNSRVVSGGTFLRNKSKVTGIQDVVTRMKAEDVEVGDTSEDIEGRGLLNKYLGSQAILSGIEGQVSKTTTSTARTASSSTAVKNTTKVTTVIMENGKEVKKTRIFEHPISNEVLETVWDEQTLRYLLEQSTDYEERKSIRARLREIMAEQEACTELVKQASQDQSGQSVDGEFLLLPLLQGLLDAPENEQTHDSGTESGEDQRSGLIAEVQNALEKLSSNLRSDTTDITPERRSSLLQLVMKLQIGLSSATSDRRHSAQMRFNRRRERPDRHTVGVSSAELADARRLIEEISCPSQSSSRTSLIPKQNSETDVDRHICSYTSMNTVPQKFCVKNSTAKPFSSSNSASVSSTSSCVQTPSESADCINYLFNDDNKDLKNSRESFIVHDKITNVHLPDNETSDAIFSPYEINQNELNIKDENNIGESEEEESTVKTSDKYTTPDIIMKNNPLYYQQPKVEKTNRYTNKKQKMRRANTIDIPKPLHFYECDDEDDETDYEDDERRRRNAYLALRGPIRVGNAPNKNSMPILEPKTENDKKFLAFIKKHNEKNQRHSLWAGNAENHFKWNDQFGHLKTNFEKTIDNGPVSPNSARNFWKSSDDSVRLGSNKYDPKISKQSARNLKKMFEEKQRKCNENSDSSNIVTGSLKFASKVDASNNYRCIPQPLPMNKFSHAPSSAFQPVNRNSSHQEVKENFGEQPLEVIKSVMSSNDPQSSDRLFLYSPKPLQNNISNPQTTTAYVRPWIGNTGEGRVLALAAKKFENPVINNNNSFEPRKLSKEKINVFPHYHDSPQDKLTAPYLVKSSDNKLNIVRKLSGQYDNLGSQMNKFQKVPQPPRTQENLKHIRGFEPKFTVPQNYSIRYDKPNLQLRTQNPPFEEHRTIPSEIKKYNQMHHTGKSDQVHHYTPSYNKSSLNTQEVSQVQPVHRPIIFNEPTHRTGAQSPSQIYQDSQKYSVPRENFQTKQFEPKFEYTSKTSSTSKVNCDARAQNTYNDRNVNMADNTKQRYSRQTSAESVKEYDAISSKVMSAPVAQTAATFRQKSPLTRNEHDMEAAFNLRNVLQKVGNSPSPQFQHQYSPTDVIQAKHVKVRDMNIPEYSNVEFSKSTEPTKQSCQPKSSCSIPENTYRAKIVQKQFPPLSEKCEVTAKGEHIVTGKFSIPTISVKPHEISLNKPSPSHILSKSDSWHQICLINQGNLQPKPSSNSSLNSRAIMKSKSTHSMIPAKQFEAGMTKDEILEKKKTLEAFFGVNSSQPAFGSTGGKVIKRAINRTKTSEKNSQNKQSQAIGMTSGLARSRTLPDIVRPDLLDESNVDKAFEDLFSSS